VKSRLNRGRTELARILRSRRCWYELRRSGILLCDYVDGTLAPSRRRRSRATWPSARLAPGMARDVQAALGFMERVAEVEPPPELLTASCSSCRARSKP